ncbi:uncharacterized protein B0H18DRAFT_1012745, partial [Fomitopsis serialis]|uniref:uncharacterized protein n=1 Tax=Fomitopsis serialis TaxID=139415 RepID=UPI00200727F4
MKFSTTFATLAAIVSGATAQLSILSPGGSDLWWVDNEVNDLELEHPRVTYAFVAEQPNYQCSVEIYATQLAKFPPATGYTIISPASSTART